jgi:zinc-binding alcohol dehydrogenase/oxidoreductase
MRTFIIRSIGELPFDTTKDLPTCSEEDVVLKLNASALNHRDLWITKGLYAGIRLGATMGADGCGTASDGESYIINPGLAWGSNETFQSSDFSVLGVPEDGTFADCIVIPQKYIYRKPAHLTLLQAAALPLAGVTAYRAIIKRAGLKKGDKVLISGIGGGVALFAMQFALALGCEVFVTSGSEEKIEKAKKLGAKAGYLYSNQDWSKQLIAAYGGVDVIIDSAGGPGFAQLVKVCNPGARIAIYGGSLGKITELNPQVLFWKQISILGSTMGSDADFREMIAFVEHHKIVPVIDRVYPLDDIHAGFSAMSSGAQFGKIVFEH